MQVCIQLGIKIPNDSLLTSKEEQRMNKREIYKLIERIESAIASLQHGVDPEQVIAYDLTEALSTALYLQELVA
jgi:hypothetical protein